jgi:HEPN domain-containing protein
MNTFEKWYRQALHDLEMAGKNISIGGYDVAAFLAQQSVEKALKAIFVKKGRKIPRTHYLDELVNILELPEEISGRAMDLTGDYMFSRYPDIADHTPFEEYTKETAVLKVQTASEVISLLIKRFPELNGGYHV